MTMTSLLVASIFLPLAGAALLGVGSSVLGAKGARAFALAITLITLGVVGIVIRGFLCAAPGSEVFAAVDMAWLSGAFGLDVRLSLGLDGLSLWMYGLSSLLLVTCVLVSWDAIRDRPALFYGMLLLLESGCLGVFAARDIILFYIFFEFTLIPLFFLIGIWGSEHRRYAAIKFFLFTLSGSLLTFLGLLTIVLWSSGVLGSSAVLGSFGQGPERVLTFSIPALTQSLAEHPLPHGMQMAVFLALFAGFAIKVPLFPLHTWLPLAHVQAPTAGSVILAGVLLKIGTYGFLRFSIPLLPDATAACMPWLMWLSVAGILYGALVALAQQDMKRLIAYSSVSHLGFCMLGMFALNRLGMQGSVLQMVNHGLSTGGLFAVVGMLYERYHTREISHLSGLTFKLPVLAFFMVLFTFSSIGLPGLNGFAGEILILMGAFQRGWTDSPLWVGDQLRWVSVLAVSGVVLGAWYMLRLVRSVFFGPLREPPHASDQPAVGDLSWREIMALAPLALFIVWIGICPQFFLAPIAPRVNLIADSAAAQLDDYSPQTVSRTDNLPLRDVVIHVD